ncbi:hypothetical protein HDU98_002454 [Podochytrium sp. JEL0797]|nr:hypothetical protein HDU98_002454 [Podochytrium sp. JEL0797]
MKLPIITLALASTVVSATPSPRDDTTATDAVIATFATLPTCLQTCINGYVGDDTPLTHDKIETVCSALVDNTAALIAEVTPCVLGNVGKCTGGALDLVKGLAILNKSLLPECAVVAGGAGNATVTTATAVVSSVSVVPESTSTLDTVVSASSETPEASSTVTQAPVATAEPSEVHSSSVLTEEVLATGNAGRMQLQLIALTLATTSISATPVARSAATDAVIDTFATLPTCLQACVNKFLNNAPLNQETVSTLCSGLIDKSLIGALTPCVLGNVKNCEGGMGDLTTGLAILSNTLAPQCDAVVAGGNDDVASTTTVEVPAASTTAAEVPAVSTTTVEVPAASTTTAEVPAASTTTVDVPAVSTTSAEAPATSTSAVEEVPSTTTAAAPEPTTAAAETTTAVVTEAVPTTTAVEEAHSTTAEEILATTSNAGALAFGASALLSAVLLI